MVGGTPGQPRCSLQRGKEDLEPGYGRSVYLCLQDRLSLAGNEACCKLRSPSVNLSLPKALLPTPCLSILPASCLLNCLATQHLSMCCSERPKKFFHLTLSLPALEARAKSLEKTWRLSSFPHSEVDAPSLYSVKLTQLVISQWTLGSW